MLQRCMGEMRSWKRKAAAARAAKSPKRKSGRREAASGRRLSLSSRDGGASNGMGAAVLMDAMSNPGSEWWLRMRLVGWGGVLEG